MQGSDGRSWLTSGQWVGATAFMLALVSILGLVVWLLHTLVSTTTLLPVDVLAPIVADTNRTTITIVVPSLRPTQLMCADCGVVASMRLVTATADSAAGNTMGNDAVVGGMIGNLLGGARGQELFGWFGAIAAMRNGGTLQPGRRYETTVRFDNGASRVFVNITRPRWRDGDRVKVVDGAIEALSPEDTKLKAELTLSRLFPVAPVWI